MNVARLWSTDMLSAVFVILLGAAGIYAVGEAEIGTARDMGTGYLPRLVALLVLGGGVVLAAMALMRDGESVPALKGKPLFLVSVAIAAFAASIDTLGMVIAVVASTAIASLASPESRFRETLLLSVGIAAGAVAVFILGLKMPVPIWPR
jgi:Tripartite tricarboxylate transporter TctB family